MYQIYIQFFPTCTKTPEKKPHTPFANSIMRIISVLFGLKIGTGTKIIHTFSMLQHYPHNFRIGTRLPNLWTQFQNVDNFQGAVKGPPPPPPRTLSRLFKFFIFYGRLLKKVWIIIWISEFVNTILVNYPHYSYADNWGMLLWKGYKAIIRQGHFYCAPLCPA